MSENVCLRDFERFNTTTESIYDLEGHKVLIILRDATNLTDWEDVEDEDEVLYVSEDLSDFTDLSRKYRNFYNLRAVVAFGVTDKVKSTRSMFAGCPNLRHVSTMNSWDLSNVERMDRMFNFCTSLSDLSALSDLDVSNVKNMDSMFSGCDSLCDLSALSDWDVGNVVNMEHMFSMCLELSDVTPLKSWDVGNVRWAECMFADCWKLADISSLRDWNFSSITPHGYLGMFDGCIVDVSIFNDLDREMLLDRDLLFGGWR